MRLLLRQQSRKGGLQVQFWKHGARSGSSGSLPTAPRMGWTGIEDEGAAAQLHRWEPAGIHCCRRNPATGGTPKASVHLPGYWPPGCTQSSTLQDWRDHWKHHWKHKMPTESKMGCGSSTVQSSGHELPFQRRAPSTPVEAHGSYSWHSVPATVPKRTPALSPWGGRNNTRGH